MKPVYSHGDRLIALLDKLVSRPRKGELPSEVPGREGIPVLGLLGDPQHADGLAELVAKKLKENELPRVPIEFVDMRAEWAKVVAERGVPSEENFLPPEWQRAELCRRVLVRLAAEFSSARYGLDRSVRFRRLGLVNWLLEMKQKVEEPDSRHGQVVLNHLRNRELARRRLFGFMRSPSTEVALQQNVPWWAYLFGLHVLPVIWFRVWRGLGSEYRWLLRQPYAAPGDPGTFIGFAVRLTQPRWGREDPEQISKLMIDAFLEDLRIAYRRRPWRRRAHRRTAYCVAFLKGVGADDGGLELVRLFAEVRNDKGAFDPLLLVTTRREELLEPVPVRELTGHPAPYDVWRHRLRNAGGERDAEFWYLPVRAPVPLPDGHPDTAQESERVEMQRVEVPPPPLWAGRTTTVVAVTAALALLTTGVAVGFASERDWQRAHCGLSRSDPDARTVRWEPSTKECVGVAPHGFAFGSKDKAVRETLDVITRQNREAEREHARHPSRPLVTLVHLSALLSTRQESDTLSYAREQLQGGAAAQYRQFHKSGPGEPLLRIFPASAGANMAFGTRVAETISEMARDDSTIVGVTGLDQSRQATFRTIEALTRAGLPMVGTTLSADSLTEQSALYYQVSPQNRREAQVAAAYARHLADEKTLRRRAVRVVYSIDPSDVYSHNLRNDAVKEFRAAGFAVQEQDYDPSPRTPSGPTASMIGEQACGFRGGLIFFAGRSEDFETILDATNENCGNADPPAFLGGDDVARLGADANRRKAFPRVPYEFLDFTVGSRSCGGASDLYGTMNTLFPEECQNVGDTSLDGHAALAFDAVNLYLKAIGQLSNTAPGVPLTPGAVWYALSGIHGDAALEGESGRIDFGGVVDQQVPLDKLISVQRVVGAGRPKQMDFCGLRGNDEQAAWCPVSEAERG